MLLIIRKLTEIEFEFYAAGNAEMILQLKLKDNKTFSNHETESLSGKNDSVSGHCIR